MFPSNSLVTPTNCECGTLKSTALRQAASPVRPQFSGPLATKAIALAALANQPSGDCVSNGGQLTLAGCVPAVDSSPGAGALMMRTGGLTSVNQNPPNMCKIYPDLCPPNKSV